MLLSWNNSWISMTVLLLKLMYQKNLSFYSIIWLSLVVLEYVSLSIQVPLNVRLVPSSSLSSLFRSKFLFEVNRRSYSMLLSILALSSKILELLKFSISSSMTIFWLNLILNLPLLEIDPILNLGLS